MKAAWILLFCAQTAFAQHDTTVVSRIDLPATQPFDTTQAYEIFPGAQLYILTSADLYNVFGYAASQAFRDIDFTHRHIYGEERNGRWEWVLRNNAGSLDSVDCHWDLADRSALYDSIDVFAGDSVAWRKSVGGDCHARFEFRVFSDRIHDAIILQEINHYGGCRAARYERYVVRFRKPSVSAACYSSLLLAEHD